MNKSRFDHYPQRHPIRTAHSDPEPDGPRRPAPIAGAKSFGLHLNASRATVKWLSAVPAPSKSVGKEKRKFQKSEKKLTKSFHQTQQLHHFAEAKQALIAGLAVFTISAPFSNNLQEVREQASVYQQDRKNLQSRHATPEVKQVQGELNQCYQALYKHWSTLERQALETELKSNDIRPLFSSDFTQARIDYDLIVTDIEMLKKKKDVPGAQSLQQQLLAKQHLLYAHLQKLVSSAKENNNSFSE